MVENKPTLIKTWAELKECESETHILEIDDDMCSGWINNKSDRENKIFNIKNCHYLSTHTFYGLTHAYSTKLLQRCGFNVILENWDA